MIQICVMRHVLIAKRIARSTHTVSTLIRKHSSFTISMMNHSMYCPQCKKPRLHVLETRSLHKDTGNGTLRRRECNECKHRFVTYEIIGNIVSPAQMRLVQQILETVSRNIEFEIGRLKAAMNKVVQR